MVIDSVFRGVEVERELSSIAPLARFPDSWFFPTLPIRFL